MTMNLTLVDSQIQELINGNKIKCVNAKLDDFVQPASLDIPTSSIAYNIKRSRTPNNLKVKDTLKNNVIDELDLTKGAILRRNNTYLIPTIDMDLPSSIFATSSPKSSIGRIDVLVRVLFDKCGLYETIPTGKKGQVWLEITPQSFNIFLKQNVSLAQIKFFEKSDKKTGEIKYKVTQNGKSYDLLENDLEVLSLHVGTIKTTGYKAIETNEVLDLTKRNTSVNKFFENINHIENGKVLLQKDNFYILRTHEKVIIPGHLSAEMVPYSNLFGELRAHYAGFFDPGFGYDKNKRLAGNYGVLEVRPFENILVENKQPVCLIKKYRNSKLPKLIYGFSKNNYKEQKTIRHAKFFAKN